MNFRALVCFIFVAVVPLVVGQAPDQAASQGTKPKASDQTQQLPPAKQLAAPAARPESSQSPKGSGTQKIVTDSSVSIATVEPLVVRADILKDWRDKLNWVLTAMLVLIGLAGVCAAVKTLQGIGRQTKAIVDAERAWLSVDSFSDYKLEAPQAEGTLDVMTFSIGLKNVGKTICRVQQVSSRFHTVRSFADLPVNPHYLHAEETDQMMAPNGIGMNLEIIFEDGSLSDAQIQSIRAHQLCLCFYACIKYLDAHQNHRECQVCYVYDRPLGLVVQGWSKEGFKIGGPKNYNKYT